MKSHDTLPASEALARELRIEVPFAPIPYERRTRMGRFSDKAQRYHERQNAIRDFVRAWLVSNGNMSFPLFPKGTALALGVEVTLAPYETFVAGRNGTTHRRNVRPCGMMDLSNLEKAVEDALNGLLYHDDRQIVERLPGWKREGETDKLVIIVRESWQNDVPRT